MERSVWSPLGTLTADTDCRKKRSLKFDKIIYYNDNQSQPVNAFCEMERTSKQGENLVF
jgi:hypothetical protein